MAEGQSCCFFFFKGLCNCRMFEAEGETRFRATTARFKLSRRLSALGGNHEWFIFHNSLSKVSECDCSQGNFQLKLTEWCCILLTMDSLVGSLTATVEEERSITGSAYWNKISLYLPSFSSKHFFVLIFSHKAFWRFLAGEFFFCDIPTPACATYILSVVLVPRLSCSFNKPLVWPDQGLAVTAQFQTRHLPEAKCISLGSADALRCSRATVPTDACSHKMSLMLRK